MNSRRLMLLSIGVNLFATAALVYLLGQRAAEMHRQGEAVSPSGLVTLSSTTPHHNPSPAAPTNRIAPFDWRQIESDDYRQYLANLRAIGCPEKTVRDIIRADVKDLFEARRAQLLGTNRVDEFWRNKDEASESERAMREQFSQLGAEKREILRSLIGTEELDPEDFAPGMLNPMAEMDRRLQFLPEDKRQKLKLILAEEAAHLEDAKVGELETRQAIERVLTQEELHEYDLHESVLAAKLRAGLDEMKPTEAEFRFIYGWWEKMEAAKELGDAAYQEQRRESETEIRRSVGSERFQRYLNGVKGWGYGP